MTRRPRRNHREGFTAGTALKLNLNRANRSYLSVAGFKLGLMPAALAGWFELLPPAGEP
jgi:hypothetical protein